MGSAEGSSNQERDVDAVITINGDTIVDTLTEYGVERGDEVIDFGDDLLGAALDAVTLGGTIRERKVYLSKWVVSEKQPVSLVDDIPLDDEL